LKSLSALGLQFLTHSFCRSKFFEGFGDGSLLVVAFPQKAFNFVSGLILLFERPVKVGDVIECYRVEEVARSLAQSAAGN